MQDLIDVYVHRRCRDEDWDVDYERVVFGYCAVCGGQGSIYKVKGAEDHYFVKKGGVTREFLDGVEVTSGPREQAFFNEDSTINETAGYPVVGSEGPSRPEPSEEAVEGDSEEVTETIPEDEEPSEKEKLLARIAELEAEK